MKLYFEFKVKEKKNSKEIVKQAIAFVSGTVNANR